MKRFILILLIFSFYTIGCQKDQKSLIDSTNSSNTHNHNDVDDEDNTTTGNPEGHDHHAGITETKSTVVLHDLSGSWRVATPDDDPNDGDAPIFYAHLMIEKETGNVSGRLVPINSGPGWTAQSDIVLQEGKAKLSNDELVLTFGSQVDPNTEFKLVVNTAGEPPYAGEIRYNDESDELLQKVTFNVLTE